jgi:hypothetical protein
MPNIKVKMTMEKLSKILGIPNLDEPAEYDLEGFGIKVNTPTGFQDMSDFIVKSAVDHHYEIGGLKTTPAHRTLVDGNWVRSKNRKDAKRIDEPMKVVDMHVPNGNCYLAGGEVNHNTTPGGRRFASLAGV